MSRKDFVAVAAAIKSELDQWKIDAATPRVAIKCTAEALADVFAASNPKFNRNIFLAACGIA